jgi:elongator complex protein 5
MPATDDRFWHHLSPGMGDALALRGAADVDVNCSDAYVVQVLLRKATGGAKAMGRSVEGFRRIKAASGASSRQEPQRWETTPLEHVVQASPLADVKTTTHADLALPFNLSLTDRQRAERGAVPLPYAHEGEGADLGMGMDWSDDEEDDEI